MQGFDRQGIIDRLVQLDGDLLALYPGRGPFDIVIVGGSAIVLRGLAPGKTLTVDIDALRTASELEGLLARYDINTHVDTFRFQFPLHFDERLARVPFPGTMLRVFTLSNEDLTITKLLAWRSQDQQDLLSMLEAGSIDMGKLKAIVDDAVELRANLDEELWDAFERRMTELESWAG